MHDKYRRISCKTGQTYLEAFYKNRHTRSRELESEKAECSKCNQIQGLRRKSRGANKQTAKRNTDHKKCLRGKRE